MADEPQEFRKPPANLEAEQALLGALLIDRDNELIPRVDGILQAEDFFDPLHQQIYETAIKLIAAGSKATPVGLRTYFESAEPVGKGMTVAQYLGYLAANAVTIINARAYAQTIRDLAIRRNLIIISEDMAKAAYDAPVDFWAADQIEEATQRLFSLSSARLQHEGVFDFRSAAQAAAAMAEKVLKDGVAGISTGLTGLDKKIGGLFPSDLVILAGRPSMGKTTLIGGISVAAAKAGVPVDFFSLEMSAAQVVLRIL